MLKRRLNMGALEGLSPSRVQTWCSCASTSGGLRLLTLVQSGIVTWVVMNVGEEHKAATVSCDSRFVSHELEGCRVSSLIACGSEACVGQASIVTVICGPNITTPFLVRVDLPLSSADLPATIHVLDHELPRYLSSSTGVFDPKKHSMPRIERAWGWLDGRLLFVLSHEMPPKTDIVFLVLCSPLPNSSLGLVVDTVLAAPAGEIVMCPGGVMQTKDERYLLEIPGTSDCAFFHEAVSSFESVVGSLGTSAANVSCLHPVINDSTLSLLGVELISHDSKISKGGDDGREKIAFEITNQVVTPEASGPDEWVVAHAEGTRFFLSSAFKSVFSAEGELLERFPWVFDLDAGDTPSAHDVLNVRELSAFLWPVFSEAIATADDWRYADSDAVALLKSLLLLALPVTDEVTQITVTYLSKTLDVPTWSMRSFTFMRAMLPRVYVEVMLWYVLYCRMPSDVMFHPSVPPISTLLHPGVDLPALQHAISVVFSNIADESVAEMVLRETVDALSEKETIRGFIYSWWSLPFPMVLDPVMLLYAEVFGEALDRLCDSLRIETASRSLINNFVVRQVICGDDSVDWSQYFSTEAPFRSANNTREVVSSLGNVATRVLSSVHDGAGADSTPAVFHVCEVLLFASMCCQKLTAEDDEETERLHAHVLRALLFSSYVRGVVRQTANDSDMLDFARERLGPNGQTVLTFMHAFYMSSETRLPFFCRCIIAAVARSYIRDENTIYSDDGDEETLTIKRLDDSDCSDTSEATSDEEEAAKLLPSAQAFSQLFPHFIMNEWSMTVFRAILQEKPLLHTCRKMFKMLSDEPRCRTVFDTLPPWGMASTLTSSDLFRSSLHFSAILDREASVFDLAFYVEDSCAPDPRTGLCDSLNAALLCELLRPFSSNGVESRMSCLAKTLARADRIRFLFVVVGSLLQRIREVESQHDDETWRDLLLWRLNRYVSDGVSSLHWAERLQAALRNVTETFVAFCECYGDDERGQGADWLSDHFIPWLSRPADDCALIASLIEEVETIEADARVAILDCENFAYTQLFRFVAIEKFSLSLCDAFNLTAHSWLELHNMSLAELWERRSLLLMSEYIRVQEEWWMYRVGNLWAEALASRMGIEEEEDFVERDAIAAQFALEEHMLRARECGASSEENDDQSSDASDWDLFDGPDDSDSDTIAVRSFLTKREAIRDTLRTIGLK